MELTRTGIIISLFVTVVTCQSDNVSLTKNKNITGQTLVDMGRTYNKPLLMLIGRSMKNLECRDRPCSDWSEWSACKLFAGQFGVRQRLRQCGGAGSNGCQSGSSPRNDTVTEVCLVPEVTPPVPSVTTPAPATCPTDYEVTGGFCLKYYTAQKSKQDAAASCRTDGGHLININSASKWTAHESLIRKKGGTTTNVYIDGERAGPSSTWVFSYETGVTGYTNWGPGDPDNGSNDLCMYAHVSSSSNTGIYDNTCTETRHYVCEVV